MNPKEITMQYKTIVLCLLEKHPEIREPLQKHRRMLPTLDLYAKELRANHLAWKEVLSQASPGSDESQIASEALELALKDLEDRLQFGFLSDDQEPLPIDAAIAFIRRHTPPR